MSNHVLAMVMAESEIAKSLKDLPVRIQTSKLKERENIFEELQQLLAKNDLPPALIKGVCKLQHHTLHRYVDSKSRRLVQNLIFTLAHHHRVTTIKALTAVFTETAQNVKVLNATYNTARTCLTALTWSCCLVLSVYKSHEECSGDEFNEIVAAQCILLSAAVAAGNAGIVRKAERKLSVVWNQIPRSADRYAASVASSEAGMHTIVMSSFIMKYLSDNKEVEAINKCKGSFVDAYIKIVVGSKTKPPLYVLENDQHILRHVTHDEFRQILLPALQKAMLRNPEIILESVGYVLSDLSLDLSQYVSELGKTLGTYLHSTDDSTREEAAVACKCLAQQCSDAEALSNALKHFLGVLNGSEGKLTVTVQRIGVITGIGNLSYNTVTGNSSQQLAVTVVTEFIKLLEQEVHEGTLVHMLTMLALWCAKFNNEVPTSLINWFQKGIGLKTTTSTVRNSYIQCMSAAFHGNTLSQAREIVPLLVKTVEKAAAQPTQTALITEGLSAACLLLRLTATDIQTDGKLGSFWNIMFDMDKQIFISERYLAQASEDALHHVMLMTERLLVDHPQQLKDKAGPLYRAIVFILTRPYLKLRRQAQAIVRKLLMLLGGPALARSLIKEFSMFVSLQKLPVSDIDRDCRENGELAGGDHTSGVNAGILAECLTCLASGKFVEQRDTEALALDSLICAHHPIIVSEKPLLWLGLLQKVQLEPDTFVAKYHKEITDAIMETRPVSLSAQNAVKTLVEVNPVALLPALLDRVAPFLDNNELLLVTYEEYEIFQTKEGELYDKSVIENTKDESGNIKNVKRESKVYSYREQMEEIELRKEIEARKKGGKTEPQLTSKQIEAMKTQLAKESVIRERLQQFHEEVTSATAVISSAVTGSPRAVSRHVPLIIQLLLPTFQSPLAAPLTTDTFLSLHRVMLDEDMKNIGILVGHVALRLLKPQCLLDSAWEEEDLTKAATRTVSLLHELSVKKEEVSFDNECIEPARLSAPEFAFCFPFLKCVLQNGGENVRRNETVLCQALEVISQHTQMRVNDYDELENPEFLPRRQMMELLIEVIGVTTGKVQHLACKVLIDVADCGSGLEGCARAQQDEIDVLLGALQSHLLAVREVALQALEALEQVLPRQKDDYENGLRLTHRVWVARHDVAEEIQKLAENLWEDIDLVVEQSVCATLLDDVIHPQEIVRQSAAAALAALLQQYPDQIDGTLQQLLKLYREKLVLPPPVMDNFGRVVSDTVVDDWEPRSGIALAIAKMAPIFLQKTVSELMTFFVVEALGDRHAEVRKHMLDAALAAVDIHGKETVSSLLPVFENFLDQAPNKASYDSVRQSVVILMGALARHLDKDDGRVKPIVAKLVESLSTPSQQVQEAVANCLPPLVPAIKEDTPTLVKKLLQLLLESSSYGERKGASYGLAGLVKGLGILALKQLDIMATLTTAIQDKKNSRHREGALFAFEQLCNMLGRLFEPYIVHVLPHLLLCFGDQNNHVRQAADDTAKAVMSKLSGHGVKLVLPALLAALEEDSWRTKTGSVELLGAMAFCAPKQLSSCLPSIVPKLIEVLSDSHVKVQKAGAQALKQIGSVIRNPEIQAIVSTLLDALQDPSKKTAMCLQTLLDTKFVHFIDAPSLALIMPVVQRAFQDRSTETRKMAAQIIGNMYSLTDQKDLAPYLPHVIPGLKQSLLDPVPEVRSVSARALGAMVRGMGETNFDELLPWLMQTLTSESSSVDRSGAAQGLSEVVGGLGIEKLQKLMPDIISTAERSDVAPHVKDGYIMMFIYMPVVFQKDFTPYIGQIINPILKALADENEFVRDTALRAGQRIVNMYAESAITLLLPELENGLFDDNWRIRYSSIQLLGDLLYKISGVSGKMSTETADEDDNFGTEHSHKAILIALGAERRNRVLAGLYMGRSDVALMVRQAALHVWKVVVTNTPRTLREILSTLFSLLLGCLASTSYDKRQVAARTLGDLVRKLGERVLPEIIPILERGLESDRPDQRQGVCIGLSEIMASTSKDMVLTFVDSLVPTVRKALCDPLPEVRQAAAKTFDSLHSTVGVRALDDILPPLLRQLGDPVVGEYTLDGLRQVMAIKSRVVLPYLVPQLTACPVNTKALSILASVAGDALTKHLHKILPALLAALSVASGTPSEQQELEYCQIVVLSVTDNIGVRTVMDELLEATRSESVGVRRASVSLLFAFCLQTRADYQQYVPQLLRGLIHLFTDSDERVLQISWEALNAVTKNLDTAEMLHHVGNVRQAVRFAVSDLKGQELLPGFCLPKGITPILPIFREAILNGVPELKEQAAQGLGEVIRLTSPDALKPSVVNITGPLIRILGDRFNWNVKVAVLDALALLLAKVGVMLKAFLPQLQTTFLKALSDPNRQVRLKAAAALSHLIVIHTRADPLFTELYMAVKNADDASIRETMLQALRVVISPAGDKIGDSVRKTMTATLLHMLAHPEDTSRMAAAGCVGALCRWLPEDELQQVVSDCLLDDDSSMERTLRHGQSVALTVALKEAPDRFVKQDVNEKIVKVLLNLIAADRIPLALNGVRGSGYYLKHQIATNGSLPTQLIVAVAKSMNHTSNEVKQLVAQVANFLAKAFDRALPDAILKPLLPMLVNGTKEKNTMVKANSEFALVAILKLRHGDETQQACMNLLDTGAREALSDVIGKVLRKVASQPEPKEEDLDDTLLT